MEKNVGSIDRALRIAGGLVLIALAAAGIVGWWGWLGVILLATGVASRCPAYMSFGVKTCSDIANKGA